MIRALSPLGIILFCWAAWYGIFTLIDAGWGWHLVIVVCAILLACLLRPGSLVSDAPFDD